MNDKLIVILGKVVWVFIIAAVFILLYSFTQPAMEQKLVLVALLVVAMGFGLNTYYKYLKKKQEDDEESSPS
ncbi:hypothetical protein OAH12_01135 [Cyclobacteriaceae bacterium]|nr:hypothetical protein [Cyclobacteriaceae bacterium]